MDNFAIKARIADLGYNPEDGKLIDRIMNLALSKISDSTIKQAWRERQKEKDAEKAAAKQAQVEPAVAAADTSVSADAPVDAVA